MSETTEAANGPQEGKKAAKAQKAKRPPNPHVIRETVESVIVAFILAFLFRAFVAEAFVIPTGSMAPTLMGAHKDTICEHCGALYQSTASPEFDNDNRNWEIRISRRPRFATSQSLTDDVAVASTCAMCRATNAFDLAGDGNHATFSGDRILVSKFDYLFRDPDRWDVLVFKFPTDARMNYIKRLVGLPGEYLRIEGGDVYVRKDQAQPWELARKPPHKALAMMQVVSDTQHQAQDLVQRGWPSLWQPQQAENSGWSVQQSVEGWSASLSAKGDNGQGDGQPQWLRHYFKVFDKEAWKELDGSSTPLNIDPYSSQLITDFLAYNTTRYGSRSRLYDDSGKLRPEVTSEHRAFEHLGPYNVHFIGYTGLAQDGLHWVGDLAAEYDVEIKGESGTVSLDVVEFGIHYLCDIDVATGTATLRAKDSDRSVPAFADGTSQAEALPTAKTAIRGAGRHRVRIANIDDQILLWIDGGLVEFDRSTAFDSHRYRTGEARRPYWTAQDPLDAAPLALGARGVDVQVFRAQVWRDIYYIAVGENYSDYDPDLVRSLISGLQDTQLRNALAADPDRVLNLIAWIHAHPQMWNDTKLFAQRRNLEFKLEEGQFFPMGDNSAASSDARVWFGHSYVERRFLIGKALLVFWPHMWNAPLPHPNLPRMGRIR